MLHRATVVSLQTNEVVPGQHARGFVHDMQSGVFGTTQMGPGNSGKCDSPVARCDSTSQGGTSCLDNNGKSEGITSLCCGCQLFADGNVAQAERVEADTPAPST
jgi:hypothetical protein